MKKYKLSNQAIGAVMMSLQKGILEQVDITEILQSFDLFINLDGELCVDNPPTFEIEAQEDRIEDSIA